ncbi:MAG: folate-binding protein YgfZ [Burkholderiaceae bacterium]|nr:folate-binding protein YgfZ [Burkholderiaceae bacterium]
MNTSENQQPASIMTAEDFGALDQGFVCVLDHLSLIQATGDDRAGFLHNLLSNDVEHLPASEARWAALCSPKGRMLASFLVWKERENIFLQLDQSLQAAIQKRLQMFVLRAKVKLADVTKEMHQLGLGGAQAEEVLRNYFSALPQQILEKIDSEHGSLLHMGSTVGHARYLWVLSQASKNAVFESVKTKLNLVGSHLWRYADIKAGIPRIVAETQDQFVPQMVNFELIGGVNFKKGCYPGQEIVARSQYLGKLKRRMAIAHVDDANVAVGAEVFSLNDTSQPCGKIVNIERESTDRSICLVEIKVSELEVGSIRLTSPDGAPLVFEPLPYSIIDVTE